MENSDNFIINQIRQEASLMSGKQRELYEKKIIVAKPVKCTSVKELFTDEEIERIKSTVRPKEKECWRNSQYLTTIFPKDVKYVEGYLGIFDFLAIDHGFNKIGDKYFDITSELVLGKDVTKDSYVSILELGFAEVLDWNLKLYEYRPLFPYIQFPQGY